MAELLDRFPIDLVQVQNLYPFLFPSILIPLPRARRPGGDALPELPPVLPQRAAPVAGRGLRALPGAHHLDGDEIMKLVSPQTHTD